MDKVVREFIASEESCFVGCGAVEKNCFNGEDINTAEHRNEPGVCLIGSLGKT